MKKSLSFILLFLILCLCCCTGTAERKTVVKDKYYLGAMRVVKCKDYVSLREAPYKTATVLAKVPLDSIVLYCNNNVAKYAPSNYKKQAKLFIRCEYDGMEGYILKQYLKPAPEAEPAETKAFNSIMSREEIIGNGSIALDWKEFNVAVLAAYEVMPEGKDSWEYLRVGCFIDDEPAWGYIESVQTRDDTKKLKAFMGGTEDEPQVYVYDLEYGLMMFDLMDGTEQWLISRNACFLGDAAVVTSGPNTGILYVAGSAGPDPVAISAEGNILWQSDVDDPELGVPTSIVLKPMDIEVTYDTDQVLNLEYNGEVIGITDM